MAVFLHYKLKIWDIIMPLQRSPTPSGPTMSFQVQSEPDIPSKIGQEFESSFVSVRNKRLRTESSKDDDRFEEFKNEIKTLLISWKTEQDSVLTSWKSEQDSVLKKIVSDISEVKVKCSDIQKCYQEFEKSLEFINGQYEEMQTRIKKLEMDKKENRDCIALLETKIRELQRMSRSATIDIRNIPQSDKETTADLTKIVCGVGNALKINLQPGDLRDIYRGPGKPGSNRTIIVDFHKVQTKYDLLTSVRNYNRSRRPAEKLNTRIIGLTSDRTPVYIDEHLSTSTKKLFFEARTYAKNNGYNFCWTSNSRVFLRKEQGSKQIHIKTEQCLRDLESGQ